MINKAIPTEALDDRLGIVGMTGSGKTYGTGVLVERILDRKGRVIIPDPLGVWWGLRLLADGKTPSKFDIVVFGGPHGDLPITPAAGALVGETVAGMRESAIIDLSQFRTAAEERRFMLAFIEALYRKTTGEPVHLVWDEADLWAPERIVDREGEATKLHGMMQNVVRRGRIKGLTSWLISQRPAALSKNVLSQVDGLVAFRLTASQDRKALGLWIEGQADREQGKAILGRLPEKQTGEAVVWLPARGILVDTAFPRKVTFDSSRSPKRGEKRASIELPSIDLGKIRDRLASVEAQVKANDPTELRKENAALKADKIALERRIAELEAAKPAADPDAIKKAAERGFEQAKKKLAGAAARELQAARAELLKGLADKIGPLMAYLGDELKAVRGAKPDLAAGLAYEPEITVPAAARPTASRAGNGSGVPKTPSRVKPASGNPVADGETPLTNPQRQLLQALAWWRAMGHDRPTRTQVAAIARWKPKGSNLRNRLTELSAAGLVAYPQASTVELTDAGIAAAPAPNLDRTLIDSIRDVLTKPQLALFNELLAMREAGVAEVDRPKLAEAVNWEPGGSNLRNRLTELRQLEVVNYPTKGSVALSEWVV